jgi:hypothetical protein
MLIKLVSFLAFSVIVLASDLDRIIPPEIKDDSFYSAIYRLVEKEPIKTVLEIGSSSGEGSTEAFVKGIEQNLNNPTLYCMELSKPRFLALQERYKDKSFVVPYNVSSVPLESFPSKEEVLLFMQTVETSLRGFTETEVTGWLQQDIDYVKNANVPNRGIELIKSENNIDYFDVVLIDGSEFTGQAEFELVYGAKWILLDDIRAFKNYHNYTRLLADPLYELVESDRFLRNGYAVFRRL